LADLVLSKAPIILFNLLNSALKPNFSAIILAVSLVVFKASSPLMLIICSRRSSISINGSVLDSDSVVLEIYQQEFLQFEYAKALEVVEELFWKYLCDNYLEICKVRCYGLLAEKYADQTLTKEQQENILAGQKSAVSTLYLVFNAILKLFAPFLPHICEELYSLVFTSEFSEKKSIHSRNNFAYLPLCLENSKALQQGEWLLATLFAVRKYKSEHNLSMKTTINKLIVHYNFYDDVLCDLGNVCNAKNVEINLFLENVKIEN
jgi:valyl-tRNA synthetase